VSTLASWRGLGEKKDSDGAQNVMACGKDPTKLKTTTNLGVGGRGKHVSGGREEPLPLGNHHILNFDGLLHAERRGRPVPLRGGSLKGLSGCKSD